MNYLTRMFLSLVLSVVFLSGCRQEREVDTGKYTIGFSQCVDDMWRQITMIQMEAEATKYPGLHLIIKNASGDTQKQIGQINELVNSGVDLLIISPNETGPVTGAAVDAYRKGIPTIIWDRKIDSKEYTTFISADNYAIGQDVGRYVCSVLPEGSTILEISGLKGSSPAIDRHNGFLDVIGSKYNVTTIAGDWQPSVARARVEDIPDYSKIDLVFGQNDEMALAAYDAIFQNNPADAGRIKFIGIDAVVGIDAVIDGRLDASFLYPPGGEFVIQTAMRILNGDSVEKDYTLKSFIVDSTNASTLKAQSDQLLNYQSHINTQKKQLDTITSSYSLLRKSVWVILVFVILMSLFMLFAFSTNKKLTKKNKELELKRIQTEKRTDELVARNAEIENLSNQKLQFFTNLSHEVRTPLTLILNPLDRMAKLEKDPHLQSDIWTLQRNAKHLLKIVNQILDFRKIENNKMVLHVQEMDIVSFTEEIVKYFETYAQTEKIVYNFRSEVKSQMMWFDPDKMEQVLINLISNAFKNSKKYGVITISITDGGDQIILEVHDTGKGMDLNTQQHVFDRFYSVGSTENHGIGIGLHLCKEYVNMHNGSLTLASELGQYTSFYVKLNKDKSLLPQDVIITTAGAATEFEAEFDESSIQDMLSKKYDKVVLVAEDDDDIREYLTSELSCNFNVISASDGYAAIKILQDKDVDIVLSDVLMPHVNGFQLCKDIKHNLATSHIPVVLLTALSDDKQQIYGIAEGADEYIRKPFNINLVKAKLIRIIEQNQASREYFTKKLNAEKVFELSSPEVESGDEIFRKQLSSFLESRYSDSSLGIEDMSDALKLSKVQLYRKSKALFGMTPVDIIRSFRLSQSVKILKENRLTISEVAYECGFSSPSYFTRCFKEKFGVSPKEYINS